MKKLGICLILLVLIASLIGVNLAFATVELSSVTYNSVRYYAGDEVIPLRQENTKSFVTPSGNIRLEVHIGAIHYKDDYSNPSEPWKDIDLTWEGNRIVKAPYELTLDGEKLSFKDKKTGEVSTLERISVKPSGLKFEVIPHLTGVSFQHILPSDKVSFEAQFKVTGNAILITRAWDDDGELELETSFKDGILTEKLSQVMDKGTGQLRAPKGDIRIDPTLTIQPSSKDNSLWQATPDENKGAALLLTLGDRASYRKRPILEFDLSELPAGASISSATLQLYYSSYLDNDPSGKTVWTYKLTRNDWVELQATWNIYKTGSDWTSAGGDYVTSNPVGGSTTFPASYDWLSWDVKAIVEDAIANEWSVAEFLIRFETEGLASGQSTPEFNSKEYTTDTSLCPKLVIEYTTVTAPAVTTQAASSVEETTATGNGNITNTGGENCDHRGIVYGTTSKGDPGNVAPGSSGYDSYEDEAGDFGTGAFTRNLTGLSQGQKYYARAYAHNSEGYSYGTEVDFTTKPEAPTSLAITDQNGSSIDLSWAKGTGATKTMIRYATGDYPATYEDGSQGYFDTAEVCVVSGLSPNITYYFRAWSWIAGSDIYSDSYSQVYGATSATMPTVTTAAATNLLYTSATGHGNITQDGGVSCTERGFKWGLTEADTWETHESGSYNEGVFDLQLTGLDADTMYYYRAYAVNQEGTSYGSYVAFTTTAYPALELWFEPNAMVSGTTLVDESGHGHHGTITWGSNSDLTITIGSTTGYESTTSSAEGAGEVSDTVTPAVEPGGWYGTATNMEDLPFYEQFNDAATKMGMTTQTLYVFAMLGTAAAVGLSILLFTGSILFTAVGAGFVILAGAGTTVLSQWMIYIFAILALGIIYLARRA